MVVNEQQMTHIFPLIPHLILKSFDPLGILLTVRVTLSKTDTTKKYQMLMLMLLQLLHIINILIKL